MVEKKYTLQDLININKRLMDDEDGCPWVKSQSFESILPYTIEEVYEVAEAIDRQDLEDIKEELGDLLYQVVFYADIAEKSNQFTMEDITSVIANKIIRRNPHIFENPQSLTKQEVLARWEEIKAQEKALTPQEAQNSTLDKVSKGLPALLQASKLCQKAAEKGFEFKDEAGFRGKFEEEFQELEEAIENNDQANIEEEFGDVLLSLSNWARAKGINPENALRKANSKFIKRFNQLEQDIDNHDKSMDCMSVSELLNHWKEAKQKTG